MQNIEMSTKGNTLTITIDLAKRLGRSASGKTIIVATTAGNQTVPGTSVVIGVNAYVKGE